MRLISATVRRYRAHAELTIEFDPSLTLIGGPNESGKSTFAEAIHRALFLKAKTGGAAQKAMVSSRFPGAPEVELRFEVGGRRYRLTKRFSGASGTATLSEESGQTWQQAEAESKLAELLGVESLEGGRGAATRSEGQWAHLWVRQGESGHDPSDHATGQSEPLLARLKNEGGAAAMESDRDSRVAAHFQKRLAEYFTASTGKTLANSDLDRAEKALALADEELARAREAHEKLDHAARDLLRAERVIADRSADVKALTVEKQAAESQSHTARDLRHREERERLAAAQAATAHESLAKTHAEIAALGERIAADAARLAPIASETARFESEAAQRRSDAGRLALAAREVEARVRECRQRLDFAKACVARLDAAARLEQWGQSAGESATRRDQIRDCRNELARLPKIEAKDLKEIQKQTAIFTEAHAELRAIAAGIEVLVSQEAVTVDGRPVPEGGSTIITAGAEIRIGETTRLRIAPGGGNRLTEARQQAGGSEILLRETLTRLGVESAEAAARIAAQRQEIEHLIATLTAELKARDADAIDRHLAEAGEAHAAAEAEIARRQEAAGISNPPNDIVGARSLVAASAAELADWERRDTTAQAELQAAEKARLSADTALSQHRQAIEGAVSQLNQSKIRLATLEETHGAAESRAERVKQLAEASREAGAAHAATLRELEALQPDALTADLARLNRALAESQRLISEAEQDRAVARSLLTRDGADDPAERLAFAEAAADSARRTHDSVARRAAAIKLLTGLFSEEQRALADRFTRPLADAITGYLRLLFGSTARATVTWAEGRFGGLALFRNGETFDFETLSGGAREQVAAAFRLAMAEILAKDHGGCLPVVFDDAFTHSDPDRVRTLQRMLDLAATRGLQIVLLTCDPAGYAALGAKTVALAGVG
jgi:DNA repair exonuclease SbcCD ATPase subunit